MQIKLDVKTLVVGIALGFIITAVLGANGVGSADVDRFGISVQEGGIALVRDKGGDFFIINPDSGMGTRVLIHRRLNFDPGRSRDENGRIFNYNQTRKIEQTKKRTR